MVTSDPRHTECSIYHAKIVFFKFHCTCTIFLLFTIYFIKVHACYTLQLSLEAS